LDSVLHVIPGYEVLDFVSVGSPIFPELVARNGSAAVIPPKVEAILTATGSKPLPARLRIECFSEPRPLVLYQGIHRIYDQRAQCGWPGFMPALRNAERSNQLASSAYALRSRISTAPPLTGVWVGRASGRPTGRFVQR